MCASLGNSLDYLTSNNAPFTHCRTLGLHDSSAPVSANGLVGRFEYLPGLILSPLKPAPPPLSTTRTKARGEIATPYTTTRIVRSLAYDIRQIARVAGEFALSDGDSGPYPTKSRYVHFPLHASLGMHGGLDECCAERSLGPGGNVHRRLFLLDNG